MALIKSVNNQSPTWGERCYFSENATLVGNITMGNDCSVWFGAVVRADVDGITIGSRVNIQDLACIHQTKGSPVVLEDDVSIGHSAVVLHGTKVPPNEIWGGIPARRIKAAAPGQSRTFSEHYLEIKDWY